MNIDRLFQQQPVLIERDWYGIALPSPIHCFLTLDGGCLLYGCRTDVCPWFDERSAAGDFAEGLWHRDVCELFLKDRHTPGYQELHLSPSGAWWSAVFSGYRRRDSMRDGKPRNVETYAVRRAASWEAALSLPLQELQVQPFVEHTVLANLCGYLGENPRQLFSAAPPPASEPDFHFAGLFVPLVVG